MAEPAGFSESAQELLEERYEVVRPQTPPRDLAEALRDHEVVWIRLGYAIDASTVAQAERCRTIVCPATGLDHVDEAACRRAGIRVLALRGEREFLRRIRATSEHALGLLLACLRKTCTANRHVRDGGWDRDRFVGRELFESQALVIGHGRLGSIMCDCLVAMGAEVTVYDPDPAVAVPPTVARSHDLREAAQRCDVASVHVNLCAETELLVSREVLAAFRPHVCLVNTSRGRLVDEVALVEVLEADRLAAYAADVVWNEHAGEDSPLVAYAQTGAENVIITPHIGGKTVESVARTELFMAEKLLASDG